MKNVRLLLVLVAIFVVACTANPPPQVAQSSPHIWLDAPLDGASLPLAPLEIVSHSTDPSRIVQVELNINGAVVRSDPNSDLQKPLVTIRQPWTPSKAGNYTLLVRAQNTAGTWGDYARAVVTVGGASTGGIVQGSVYSDLNGNGLPNDPEDAPLDGVLVTLTGCTSKTATTVNGTFQFTGLPAGTCLVEVAKIGWKFSGTYPSGIGYPAQAASDLAKPTAFSLFMTPLATRTPTLVPKAGTPSPVPPAGIAFFVDQPSLISGQCTTMHWQVTNASQVTLDNATVAGTGSKLDCPTVTTTHSLRVVTLDKQTVQRALTITVRAAPVATTPAPPPVVPPRVLPSATPPPTAPPPIIPPRVLPSPTPTRPFVPPVRRLPTNTPTATRPIIK